MTYLGRRTCAGSWVGMPRIIMNHAFIARWTRTPHSIGRLSASASSHHSLSSAAFIINIAESDFRHALDRRPVSPLVNRLSLRPIFPEPSVVRIEWAEPCLPRHLSRFSLIEMAVYRDFQEVDHEKPNKIVEPYEADEAPGNGGDEPAESRDACGQNLRAQYGGKKIPLGEWRLEKKDARNGPEKGHEGGDDQLDEQQRLHQPPAQEVVARTT